MGLNYEETIQIDNSVKESLGVNSDAIIREGIKILRLGSIASLESIDKADDWFVEV